MAFEGSPDKPQRRVTSPREALVARWSRALAELATRLSVDVRLRALAAPTDMASLCEVLADANFINALASADPGVVMRLRGVQRMAELLEAEGGSLTSTGVARLLAISRQAVPKRATAGSILAVRVGRHGHRFPSWQFGPKGVLPGIAEVIEAIEDPTGWTRLAFFLESNARTGHQRPLDALRRGDLDLLVRAARAEAVQDMG